MFCTFPNSFQQRMLQEEIINHVRKTKQSISDAATVSSCNTWSEVLVFFLLSYATKKSHLKELSYALSCNK